MSRIGSSVVNLPEGVSVTNEAGILTVKGKNGELSASLHGDVEITISQGEARLKPVRETRLARALWGTMRANLNNMVVGVTTGFTRQLEISGVGYRAAMQGTKLVLSLGYSHPVEMAVPEGLTVSVENNTLVTITGADKQLLGQFASEVRAKRPPEPFKGKGVKYAEETIVRKEGKKK